MKFKGLNLTTAPRRGALIAALAALAAAALPAGRLAAVPGGAAGDGTAPPADAIVLDVAEGVRQVRVQVYNEVAERWDDYTIAHLDGRAGEVKIRVPEGIAKEHLRVSTSTGDPFDYSFYTRHIAFDEETFETSQVLAPGAADFDATAGAGANEDRGATEEVVESDIWKLDGDTLYFFNQYRGLQVFDLSDRANPRLLGRLRMAAQGEQFYLVGGSHVALLANGGWGRDSEVVVVSVEGGQPEIVERFPVPGQLAESRMVGGRLYTVSQRYESWQNADGIWESDRTVTVSAFDLGDPAAPVLLEAMELPDSRRDYYFPVVSATSTHLLVSLRFYENSGASSTVYVVDISDPAAGMSLRAQVPAAGYVADKFKLQLRGNILTVLSQVWRWGSNRRAIHTVLETYDLGAGGPDGYERLAELSLGLGEQLFGTRFDGDRVYIVTFLRIDPLWVVDLKDPANPIIAGELEIPGWSTYLQPFGDTLVAVGVEDRRVTISLFDVADPANPGLTKRVYLGEEGEYTWSEGNYDEKAVSILPGEDLILVPYQGWSRGDNSYTTAMQLIDFDLEGTDLTLRGSIEHESAARRASTLGESHLVSISGKDLVVVDATDRDAPAVVGELEIAWSVDRVYAHGDYLLQVEDGNYWRSGRPALRVSTKEDPERVLQTVDLDPEPVVGVALKGDCLFVAQKAEPVYIYKENERAEVEVAPLVTTIFEIGADGELSRLGAVEAPSEDTSWNRALEASWLGGGQLVWHPSQGQDYYWWWWGPFDAVRGGVAIDAIAEDALFWPGYYYADATELIALDVGNKAAPTVLSTLVIEAEPNATWGTSEVIFSGDLAYLSRQTYDWDEKTNLYTGGHYLEVADYADPANPVVRPAVDVPGKLVGVVEEDGGGTVLITGSERYWFYWWEWRIPGQEAVNGSHFQASVYDGTGVFLVDEVSVEGGYNGTYLFDGRSLYQTVYPEVGGDPYTVVPVYWHPEGNFQQLPALELAPYPGQLSVDDGLLMTRTYGELNLSDVADPLNPGAFQSYPLPTFIWFRDSGPVVDRTADALFPSGLYGVEKVVFDPPFPPGGGAVAALPGPNRRSRNNAGGAASWTEVDLSEIELACANDPTAIGVLGSLRWLFRPEGMETEPALRFETETYDADEGSGMVALTVMRDGDTTAAATFTYAALNGRARGGSDFANVGGRVNFAPGESSKTIEVALMDDRIYEFGEDFYVFLQVLESGANLGGERMAKVTIADDDGAEDPGALRLTGATYTTAAGVSTGVLAQVEAHLEQGGGTWRVDPVNLGLAAAPAGAPGLVRVTYQTGEGHFEARAGDGQVLRLPGEGDEAIAMTFGQWLSTRYSAGELADPGTGGMTADPDGNGIGHVLEFALLPPDGRPAREGLPAIALQGGPGGERFLEIHFRPNPGAADLSYTVEVSADMVGWTSGHNVTEVVSEPGAPVVVVRDRTPASGGGAARFIRLRVDVE